MKNLAKINEANALDLIEAATQSMDGKITAHYDELHLISHFQPIYSLVHKRPVGYEALLRAQNLAGNNIPPLAIFNMGGFKHQVQKVQRDAA